MIYIPVNHLTPGMRLAQDVYLFHPIRLLLMEKGQECTLQSIHRLKLFDIDGVYISDGRFDDIQTPPPIIDEELKSHAIVTIKDVFNCATFGTLEQQSENLQNLSSTVTQLVDSVMLQNQVMPSIQNLKAHDEYTFHHSLSVSVLTIAAGVQLCLTKKNLFQLGTASLLHDIGKLSMPTQILNKPSRLTDEEFKIIKTHSLRGAEYLQQCGIDDEFIFNGVIYHHEKWDGTGYPNGLSGADIPIIGRIICIADVYDALTSNRPYRSPALPSEAIEYLMGNCGTFFDYDIMTAFLSKVELYPVGSCVQLSNGKTYVVIDNHNNLRPIVRSVNDPAEIIDLQEDKEAHKLTIVQV